MRYYRLSPFSLPERFRVPGRGALNRSVRLMPHPLRLRHLPHFRTNFSQKMGEAGWGHCAKINIMKAIIPQPVHESYKRHRKELVWQIILPMVLTSLLLIALIVLINVATFRDGGDVGRWAAISTIWIVIPIMLGLLIVTALLGGLVYLMQKLLNITPTYTGMAQDYVYLAQGYIKRATEAIVKPVLELNGILASIIAFFERMK